MLSLPIVSEWEEKRIAFLHEMRDGLRGVGADASIDSVETAERPLQLLRVRVPARWIEEADVWLMRLIQPWSRTAAWAGHVELLLAAFRWPESASRPGPSGDVAIRVPAAFVDRALAILRERFA